MTAEAWVAILAVACVGLLLIAGMAIRAWWSSLEEIVEANEDATEAILDLRDARRETLDALEGWSAEVGRREWVEAERDLAQTLLEFGDQDLAEAQSAVRLALTFYGRALAIAEQSGMEYANVLDELGILRDSLDDARAELEDIA